MSRVTEKGQVTIPKEIREEMGIKKGDEVEFKEIGGEYLLKKRVKENPFEKWRGVADTEKTVEDRMKDLRGNR